MNNHEVVIAFDFSGKTFLIDSGNMDASVFGVNPCDDFSCIPKGAVGTVWRCSGSVEHDEDGDVYFRIIESKQMKLMDGTDYDN